MQIADATVIGSLCRDLGNFHDFMTVGAKRILCTAFQPGLQQCRENANVRNADPAVFSDRLKKTVQWSQLIHSLGNFGLVLTALLMLGLTLPGCLCLFLILRLVLLLTFLLLLNRFDIQLLHVGIIEVEGL